MVLGGSRCFDVLFFHTPPKNRQDNDVRFFFGKGKHCLFFPQILSFVLFFIFQDFPENLRNKPATIFVFSTALIELDRYTRWVGIFTI